MVASVLLKEAVTPVTLRHVQLQPFPSRDEFVSGMTKENLVILCLDFFFTRIKKEVLPLLSSWRK